MPSSTKVIVSSGYFSVSRLRRGRGVLFAFKMCACVCVCVCVAKERRKGGESKRETLKQWFIC